MRQDMLAWSAHVASRSLTQSVRGIGRQPAWGVRSQCGLPTPRHIVGVGVRGAAVGGEGGGRVLDNDNDSV